MADVQIAVEFAMRLEDSTLSGNITDIPGDVGGKTRFGLASVEHPELTETTYFTTMDRATALLEAVHIITEGYAEPLDIFSIHDQALANVFLGYAVNEGPQRAIQTMQDAVNRVYPQSQGIVTDGIAGPSTIAAINRVMPITLLNAFRVLMVKHYTEKAKDNVLRGLLRRALA